MQRLALFDLDNTLINLDEAFKVWSAEFAKEHALGAEATGQLALTCLPAMNGVFGTAPIGGDAWLRIPGRRRRGHGRGRRRQAAAGAVHARLKLRPAHDDPVG
ncbi:hypothetical protein ABZ917_10375 [Nonomuraea wenchangensis]